MSEFERTFTLAEAEALLPDLRAWLTELWGLDRLLVPLAQELVPLLRQAAPANVGGPQLVIWFQLSRRWHEVAGRIVASGAQLKDLPRGTIDFPHERPDGSLAFLCWQMGEDRVEWWHEVDDGFAGRQRLDGQE